MILLNEALDIKVIPQFPRKIVITWDFAKDLPYPISFNIYRSGSSGGEFEKLNQSPFTEFYYEDIGLKPLSKILQVNYKLEILSPTKDPQVTAPFPLIPAPRLKKAYFIARRMDQKYQIEYRSHTGLEIEVFKRRHWGERCIKCFNPVTESSTRADCNSCFGTTFKEGFWKGISSLAKLEPSVKSQILDPSTNYSENLNNQITLRAFPLVKKGDIIAVKATGVRWYVHTVQLTEHTLFPVKQVAQIREIERGSSLYRLGVKT